jgi:hypothetical protein
MAGKKKPRSKRERSEPVGGPPMPSQRASAKILLEALARTAGESVPKTVEEGLQNFHETPESGLCDCFYVLGLPEGQFLTTSCQARLAEDFEKFGWDTMDYGKVEVQWWSQDRSLDPEQTWSAIKAYLYHLGRDGRLRPASAEAYSRIKSKKDRFDRQFAFLDRNRPDAEVLEELTYRFEWAFGRPHPERLRFAD